MPAGPTCRPAAPTPDRTPSSTASRHGPWDDTVLSEALLQYRDLDSLECLEHSGVVIAGSKGIPGGIRQAGMEHFAGEPAADLHGRIIDLCHGVSAFIRDDPVPVLTVVGVGDFDEAGVLG
jgi:hypothetical protein